MKLGVVLEDTVQTGGGFSQAVSAILQIERLAKEKFSFVLLTSKKENLVILGTLGLTALLFKTKLLDKVVDAFGAHEYTRRILRYFRLISPFEKFLIKNGCDLVYFVSPSKRVQSLQRINFILTIWDSCHRDFPEFPEVRSFGEFNSREMINDAIHKAYLAIVDSKESADLLVQRYGIDRIRLLVMPFAPSALLKFNEIRDVDTILAKYRLRKGFLLYPAQFWPHKNHIRIIQALALLRQLGETPVVVFVGGDRGSKGNVLKRVVAEGLQDQVRVLGFVPSEHLRALYEGCHALLMPTYFGPTNIPPLEAWEAQRPVIYSKHLAGQCGDAAILIDPDDAQSLADGILECQKEEVRERLVYLGIKQLEFIERERNEAEKNFSEQLKIFNKRLTTWS